MSLIEHINTGYTEPIADLRTAFFLLLGKLDELRQIIGDGKPRSLARDINMHLWSDARVVIQRAQRQADYRPVSVEFG